MKESLPILAVTEFFGSILDKKLAGPPFRRRWLGDMIRDPCRCAGTLRNLPIYQSTDEQKQVQDQSQNAQGDEKAFSPVRYG